VAAAAASLIFTFLAGMPASAVARVRDGVVPGLVSAVRCHPEDATASTCAWHCLATLALRVDTAALIAAEGAMSLVVRLCGSTWATGPLRCVR
jgi:hypothetical protein